MERALKHPRQFNFRVDAEILEALDQIRASIRPIPSMAETIRLVVLDKARELKAAQKPQI